MAKTGHLKKAAAAALALVVGAPAFAVGEAGSVSYVPVDGVSVPTLSEWALAALALCMAAWAYRALRDRAGGKPLAALLLVGALAAAGGSGQLARLAYAVPAVLLDQPNGGTVLVGPPGESQVTNTSGRAQRITAVSPLLFTVGVPVATPACTVGLVVAAGASCYVNFQ